MALALALRGMWLPLVVVLGMVVGATSTAANREAEGFSDSGYMWPKTLLWRGMRSSPGSLWFFYAVFLTAASFCVALSALMAFPSLLLRIRLPWMNSPSHKCAWHGGLVGGAEYLLAGGLLFVGLGVTQLSDVVEAYLAGMTSIQLLFTGLVFEAGSSSHSGRRETLFGFQFGAVLGIALLDSHRPLNVLNTVYSVVGVLVLPCCNACSIRLKSRKKRGVWHLAVVLGQVGFSIAAYLVADEVEGVHRRPMLALLSTACFFSVVIFILECLIDPIARKAWQDID